MKHITQYIFMLLFSLCLQPTTRIVVAQDTLDCQQIDFGEQLVQLPDAANFFCSPGFASDGDFLLIYASNGDPGLESYNELEVNGNAIYLLDAAADGTVNLIISFTRTTESFIAQLFDDQNGDGQVSYVILNSAPVISESPYWTMQVTATESWGDTTGTINYNLDLLIDGRVDANWISQVYIEEFFNDGRVDFHIKVRDTNRDGSPDYEIRQSYQPDNYWYVASTWLGVADQPQGPPIKGAVIWPYLGGGHFDFFQRYNNFYAPIQVDWSTSIIDTLVEFVPSHEGDDVWYVQSFAAFGEGGQTYANFENPVCWVDLANDQDGYPELHIRQEYYGSEDQYHWYDMPPSNKNDIRYTWDQDNDQSWDYKLGLSGSYAMDQEIQVGDVTVRTIPCDDFPNWILSKPWGPAVFIAAYQRNYAEGIYEWGTVNHELERYVFGYADAPDYFSDMSIGYRGEYTYDLNTQPWLYLHPVDHMVHLKGSDRGIYQISKTEALQYSDSDHDGYIDRWQFFENTRLVHELYLEPDYLVYLDLDRNLVSVKILAAQPFFEEFLPPGSHTEWDELSSRLINYDTEPEPRLNDMFSGVPGEFDTFEGVRLNSLRSSEQQLRLELTLFPGFEYTSSIGSSSDLWAPPGEVVVWIGKNQSIDVSPGGPPVLNISRDSFRVDPPQIEEFQASELTWLIANQGNGDAESVNYKVTITSPSNAITIKTGTIDLLPANGQIPVSIEWSPVEAGAWEIEVQAFLSEDENIVSEQLATITSIVNVEEQIKPGLMTIYSLPSKVTVQSVMVLALLLSSVASIVFIFLRISKHSTIK